MSFSTLPAAGTSERRKNVRLMRREVPPVRAIRGRATRILVTFPPPAGPVSGHDPACIERTLFSLAEAGQVPRWFMRGSKRFIAYVTGHHRCDSAGAVHRQPGGTPPVPFFTSCTWAFWPALRPSPVRDGLVEGCALAEMARVESGDRRVAGCGLHVRSRRSSSPGSACRRRRATAPAA